MGLLTEYREALSLVPGRPYRVDYSTYCLNSIPNAQFAVELVKQGILTNSPGVSGPVTAAISGYRMEFSVKWQMSSSQFSASLIAAFAEASKQAWFSCSVPEISKVQEPVPGGGFGFFDGFGSGAVFALAAAVAIVLIWRAR